MADTYVLVCQNADCKARGAAELLDKLSQRLKDNGGVEVKPYMCFGACQAGPNIVVYPNKVSNRPMWTILRSTRKAARRSNV